MGLNPSNPGVCILNWWLCVGGFEPLQPWCLHSELMSVSGCDRTPPTLVFTLWTDEWSSHWVGGIEPHQPWCLHSELMSDWVTEWVQTPPTLVFALRTDECESLSGFKPLQTLLIAVWTDECEWVQIPPPTLVFALWSDEWSSEWVQTPPTLLFALWTDEWSSGWVQTPPTLLFALWTDEWVSGFKPLQPWCLHSELMNDWVTEWVQTPPILPFALWTDELSSGWVWTLPTLVFSLCTDERASGFKPLKPRRLHSELMTMSEWVWTLPALLFALWTDEWVGGFEPLQPWCLCQLWADPPCVLWQLSAGAGGDRGAGGVPRCAVRRWRHHLHHGYGRGVCLRQQRAQQAGPQQPSGFPHGHEEHFHQGRVKKFTKVG